MEKDSKESKHAKAVKERSNNVRAAKTISRKRAYLFVFTQQ